jgi:predicted small lipoprotein YifL
MKKLLVMGIIIFTLFALVACGRNGGTQDTVETPRTQNEIPPTNPTTSAPDFPVRTIEELGGIISAAGAFWEDWWSLQGMFCFDTFIESEELPAHIAATRGAGIGVLSPSSGFENMNDIRNFLLRDYTENLTDAIIADEIAFFAYDGTLFVDVTRMGSARPNWDTAPHVLVEQNGSQAVVETTVLWGGWHRHDINAMNYAWEVQYRFYFNNGRIDRVYGELAYQLQINEESKGNFVEVFPPFYQGWKH